VYLIVPFLPSHIKTLVQWVWNVTSVLMNSYHMSILRSQRQMPPHLNDLQEWLVLSGCINGGLEIVRDCEIQFLKSVSLGSWHFGTQQREAFVPACVHDIVMEAEGDCSDNAWLRWCVSEIDSIECITILRRKSLVMFFLEVYCELWIWDSNSSEYWDHVCFEIRCHVV